MRDDIDDHKNFKNTDADPPQRQSETNSNKSNNNEKSYECKELEHHGSNELAAEDDISIREPINQIYEEGSSSNEEGIQKTTEVSPSQDEFTKIHDNNIHAIEVEESTEKQHEDPEDGIPYSTHDDVLADQNLENTNAYPSQQHNETNSNKSNNSEESYECKELHDQGSNMLHVEDEINTKEPINQIYEEGSSCNEESIQKTIEVSPSQDECTKIHDNSIPAIEVEESTEEKHEDGIPYSTHDDVLAYQSIQADPADKIQYITNCAIDCENSKTLTEVDKDGSDDHSKVMDCTDEKTPEKLQDADGEKQGLAMKEVELEKMAEESSIKDGDFDQHMTKLKRIFICIFR